MSGQVILHVPTLLPSSCIRMALVIYFIFLKLQYIVVPRFCFIIELRAFEEGKHIVRIADTFCDILYRSRTISIDLEQYRFKKKSRYMWIGGQQFKRVVKKKKSFIKYFSYYNFRLFKCSSQQFN